MLSHSFKFISKTTFNEFLYIQADDLKYVATIFWTCFSAQNTLKRYKSTLRWSLHLSKVSFYVTCGVYFFGWLSMYWCPWLGVFGSNLIDLPQFNKYTKTGLIRPSDCLYPWVRLHLMWNVEFNTLNDFLFIGVNDMRYLGPIFATCPNSPNVLKQV